MRVGEETFPLDLVEELAQDDDGDVRQLVAEQLGVLADALRESRTRQEDEVYTGLLCVAFLLVEDDVDGVVSAAEHAAASVAGLLEGHARAPADADRQPRDVRGGGDPRLRRYLLAREGSGTGGFRLATRAAARHARRGRSVPGSRGDRARSPRSAPRRGTGASDARWRRALAATTCGPCGAPPRRRSSRCPRVYERRVRSARRGLFESLANDVSYQVRAAMLEHLGPLISALGGARGVARGPLRERGARRVPGELGQTTRGEGLQLACAFNLLGVALAIGRARWHEIREAHATLADSVQCACAEPWRARCTKSRRS